MHDAPGNTFWPAHDQRHTHAEIIAPALAARNARAVVDEKNEDLGNPFCPAMAMTTTAVHGIHDVIPPPSAAKGGLLAA